MSVPTVQVTIKLNDQSGAPVPGARVIARLTSTERYQGYVVPKEYTGEAGADGIAVVNIFPNELGSEGSEYIFKITDPRTNKTVRVYASIPNTNCELHSVAELDRYELRGAGEIITSEVATYAGQAATSAGQAAASASAAATSKTGADTAKAGADTAKAGADTAKAGADAAKTAAQSAQAAAESARDLAAGYRDTAQSHANTASTQAGVATTKASESAASATTATTQAGVATTKAGEASASASAAATSKTGADTAKTGAEAARDLASGYAGTANSAKAQAETARDLASGYATTAAGYRDKAQEWAEKTSGAVETGAYSAKYHAQSSQASATESANSASSAATDADRAEAAAEAAEQIATGGLPDATELVRGIAEIATAAETQSGAADNLIITPLKLAAEITRRATPAATEGTAGKVALASTSEVATGTDATKAVTPAGLASRVASESVTGLIRRATASEASTGSDDTAAMTPAKVKTQVDAVRTEIAGRTISVSAPLTGGGAMNSNVSIGIGAASESATGVVELGTSAEALAGTDAVRAITPATLKAFADARLAGFDQTTNRHVKWTGSALGDIAVNSVYGFSRDEQSDAPGDMAAATWGFVQTMMYSGSATHGTQIVYSMTLPNNIWMRRKATTWGTWERVYATPEQKPSSFTATSGSHYLVNAGTTVTLPSSPAMGAKIKLTPYVDITGANKVTLDPGALKIRGSAMEYRDYDQNVSIELTYTIAAIGWQI